MSLLLCEKKKIYYIKIVVMSIEHQLISAKNLILRA